MKGTILFFSGLEPEVPHSFNSIYCAQNLALLLNYQQAKQSTTIYIWIKYHKSNNQDDKEN